MCFLYNVLSLFTHLTSLLLTSLFSSIQQIHSYLPLAPPTSPHIHVRFTYSSPDYNHNIFQLHAACGIKNKNIHQKGVHRPLLRNMSSGSLLVSLLVTCQKQMSRQTAMNSLFKKSYLQNQHLEKVCVPKIPLFQWWKIRLAFQHVYFILDLLHIWGPENFLSIRAYAISEYAVRMVFLRIGWTQERAVETTRSHATNVNSFLTM